MAQSNTNDIKKTTLETAILAFQNIQDWVEQKSMALKAALQNGVSGDALTKYTTDLEDIDRILAMEKKQYAAIYPNEPTFFEIAPTTQSIQDSFKPVSMKPSDVPALVLGPEGEPPFHCFTGKVYRDAPGFLNHLETLLQNNNWSINLDYNRVLQYSMGKTIRAYIEEKRAHLQQSGEKETWAMVKSWLLGFNDTPEQRFRNLQSLVKLEIAPTESSATFAARMAECVKRWDAESFSAGEILVAHILRDAACHWQRTFEYNMVPMLVKGQKNSMEDMAQLLIRMNWEAEDPAIDETRENEYRPPLPPPPPPPPPPQQPGPKQRRRRRQRLQQEQEKQQGRLEAREGGQRANRKRNRKKRNKSLKKEE